MIDNSSKYDVKVGDDDDDDDDDNDDDDVVSNDDDNDTVRQWKKRRRRRPSRPSRSSPFASSSSLSHVPLFFVPRYLQTIATAILAFSGFICILISAQSCQFLTVSHTIHYYYYYDNDNGNDTIINDNTKFSNSNNSNNGRSTTFSSSVGIFCNSNDKDIFSINDDFIIDTMNNLSGDDNDNDIMLALSRAFTCISILFSLALSIITIGMSTTFISPSMTTMLWNGRDDTGADDGCASSLRCQICNVSFLAAITFVFHLPILFLLDSRQCKDSGGSVRGVDAGTNQNIDDDDDASASTLSMMMEISNKCTLSDGSIPLLVSMGMHVALALFTHGKDCPDWREEYELWKLMKQQRIDRENCGEKGIHDGVIDEEHGRIETMTTTVDDEERQIQHPAAAIAEVEATAMVEQPLSRKLWQKQPHREPVQMDGGANPVEENVINISNKNNNRNNNRDKMMNAQYHLPDSMCNGTRNNVNIFSPPTSPSTPPPPPPMSPLLVIESNDDILHDLDTSLLTSSVASVCSRDRKKNALSKFLREERIKREIREGKELNTKPKQLRQVPSTVDVAPFDSGYVNTVGGEEEQPTNDAILHNQHELLTKKSSTRPPFVSICINHDFKGGPESNNVASVSVSAPGVDADMKSKPFFIAEELEWPSSAENYSHDDDTIMVPHSMNDEPSSPSSMRIKMMKTSSPLTKFSSQMAMMVNNDIHDANHIIHVVHDDNDEKDGDGFEGGGTMSYDDNQNCKIGGESDSSFMSIKRSTNGDSIIVADSSTGAAAPSFVRIVSPDKGDHDPEIDIYPSDGSLSTLSLATDDYRSSDDEDGTNRYCSATNKEEQHQMQQQQQEQQQDQQQQDQQQEQQPNRQQHDEQLQKQGILFPTNENRNFLSDDYSSEDSELSAVIAGVQKLNRKTSGKITPLNKRRRRKRGSTGVRTGQSSACSMSASSFSSHGSLLDEVIVEEGELNSSNEGVGGTTIVHTSGGDCGGEGGHGNESTNGGVPILPLESGLDKASSLPSSASPSNTSTSKKMKKKKKQKIRPHRTIHGNDISIEDSIGSDHSINSDGSSNTEDSNISAAARERRNRIATQRQSRIDPEGEYDSSSLFSRPVSPDAFPELLHNISRGNGRKVDNHRGMNHRPPPMASVNSNSSVDQKAWQARKVRMMRLRMIRGRDDDVGPVVRGAGSGGSSSDGDIDDFAATTNIVTMIEKPPLGGMISRARQGVILACSSDEDSI